MEAIEIPFSLDVPKGIRFYSAHFKIDAFKWFAQKDEDEYSILLDNDIVALHPFPNEFYRIIDAKMPMCYSLSCYVNEQEMSDVHKIDKGVVGLIWKGGEFIGGTASFFQGLYQDIMAFSDKYFSIVKEGTLFHIGDEMLVNIALNRLQQKQNLRLVDAGMMGFIHRYWSVSDKYTLNRYKTSLIHLPGDKVLLNKLNISKLSSLDYFYSVYRNYKVFCFINKIRINILKKLKR